MNKSDFADSSCHQGERVIVLDVGGTRYHTTLHTLRSLPETFLGRMFNEENESLLQPQPDGSYFIDRDGKLFRWVLHAHRTGDVLYPNFDLEGILLEQEYIFFGLCSSAKIQEEVARRETEKQTEESAYNNQKISVVIRMLNYTQRARVAKEEIEEFFDYTHMDKLPVYTPAEYTSHYYTMVPRDHIFVAILDVLENYGTQIDLCRWGKTAQERLSTEKLVGIKHRYSEIMQCYLVPRILINKYRHYLHPNEE